VKFLNEADESLLGLRLRATENQTGCKECQDVQGNYGKNGVEGYRRRLIGVAVPAEVFNRIPKNIQGGGD